MIHIRTLDGSIEEMIDPAFRKFEFKDEMAVITVSTHLRHTWTALSEADVELDPNTALANFMKTHQSLNEKEWRDVPQDSDVNTLHSAWRDAIYYHWNHVFWDVSKFLGELSSTGVHMHPPSQEVFAVDYQSGQAGIEKVWETDILVIPAYLAPGISVRLSMRVDSKEDEGKNGAGDEQKTLGAFDGTNVHEIWYVKRNTAVTVHIDMTTEGSGDVAAVMVYGMLCRDSHTA